jgi:tetratricopeptide (TPR) repeat protein
MSRYASLGLVLLMQICMAADLEQLLKEFRANPADWKLAHETALAYTERSRFAEAAIYYRKALNLNPSFLPARKNLAVVLWFDGKHAEAESLFRQLALKLPKDPVPRLYLGLAAHARAQHAEAYREFASAGELATLNPDVFPEVLESYLAAGDKSLARNAAKLVESTKSTDLSLRTAAVLDRYGCVEEAYQVYRSTLSFASSQEIVYLALASFASAHQNNEYGLKILERGQQVIPASAALHFHHGLLSALEGRRDRAIDDFAKAVSARPGWTLPILARGVLQLEDGQYAESADTFGRVLSEHPGDTSAAYLRALALSRTGDNSSRVEQLRLLENAVRLKPVEARALTLLGRTYAETGREKDAIECLKKAVAADSRNANAHYQLSMVLRRAGHTAEARQHLARFQQLRAPSEESELVQFLKVQP